MSSHEKYSRTATELHILAHIATAAAGRGLRYLNSRLVISLLPRGPLLPSRLLHPVSQSHALNFSLAMSLGSSSKALDVQGAGL